MSDNTGKTAKVWTPSNIITITRILLVPLFVAVLLAPWPEWFSLSEAFSNDWKGIIAAGVFVLISCTDWLDGYLARSRGEITDFGKFMDPLADKILVTAALVALVELGDLPTWVVLVILAREFIVSGMRMMAASKGTVIAASMLGKFKTVFQMIAIVLFVVKDSHMVGTIGEAFSDFLWVFSWAIMIVALALTVASMIDYLVKGKEILGFGPSGTSDDVENTQTRGEESGGLEQRNREIASRVVEKATRRSLTFCTAESLTGGMIGSFLTSVAGSSAVYLGGVISYTNGVKNALLDVDGQILEREGAVCEEVACQMAEGARTAIGCDIAVAVTGIAGPGGAEPGKPIGTVWMGMSTEEGSTARCFHFEGTRDEVRLQTAEQALLSLDEFLS